MHIRSKTGKHPGYLGLIMLLSALILISGCETVKGIFSGEEASPAPKYYDFSDILIPAELKLVPKDSIVYETHGTKVGVLVFKGRVEVDSLVGFFLENMKKDGWDLVNSVKFSRRIMNFIKGTRSCHITIRETSWTTHVEIWVDPIKAF